MSDAELWRRGCDGDQAAVGELFRRHAQAIFVFLVRRTGDRELAEDLTSTVFLEAWRKRRDVRLSGDSALPWLYGVAVNCSRNVGRSLRRHRDALARLALERPPSDPDEARGAGGHDGVPVAAEQISGNSYDGCGEDSRCQLTANLNGAGLFG